MACLAFWGEQREDFCHIKRHGIRSDPFTLSDKAASRFYLYPDSFEARIFSAGMVLEKITFGKDLPGYVGGPKDGRPAVIVLQEWWGITEEIKSQAEHISKSNNYRVLVPDLYKGKLGVNAEEANHLMDDLDWEAAVGEIRQACEFLRSEGAPKVGAIGFCMGGALALLAAEWAGVNCAVSFYGTPSDGHPEKITVPVQTHSGSNDSFKGFADPATVKPWTERVPGGKGTFYEYEGEGHAFMNAGKDVKEKMATGGLPLNMKKESQELGWKRALLFFKTQMG